MAENMEGVTGGGAAEEPVKISTIYVNNLEEREKIEDMQELLKTLFSRHGTVIDIIMKKSLKRKGQAFVVFENPEQAQAALILDGFMMHGKKMRVAIARTPSDATVKRRAPDKFDEHKKRRTIHKQQKEVAEAKEAKNKPQVAADKPRVKTGAQAVPSEYVPPNRVIMLENLPDDVDQEAIAKVYSGYEGYQETRYVPFRKLAFIEFADETFAIPAKESTNNMTLGAEQKPVKVTYKRS